MKRALLGDSGRPCLDKLGAGNKAKLGLDLLTKESK